MRIAQLSGRLTLIQGELSLDVEQASRRLFSADPQAIYSRWDEFVQWADTQAGSAQTSYDPADLGPVTPRPPQIFAIGLNYARHASESGFAVPDNPVVFTKFASSLGGPNSEVTITGERVDWEAELVAVVGRGGRDIAAQDGWQHVAGLTVGQDLSDRDVQLWGDPPQFSLGKSRAGFAPLGPNLVTLDEVDAHADRDDLAIRCTVTRADGSEEVLQDGRTRDLIFSIPALISRLSQIVELLPGDLIFTGTPDGVGLGRTPPVFLAPGEVLTTQIEAIGQITQRFVARR